MASKVEEGIGRRNAIPIIHTRGTHYEIGFDILFLMHLDDIVPNVVEGTQGNPQPVGCSTVICNQPGQEILGHTEDALSETLNHWYLVSAHVIEPGLREEKFTSLSYAGFLPGYTMGYNHHGLVYTVNTLSANKLRSGKTPRYFLARSLLGVENFVQAQQALRNEGYGAAEGFSVNMTFLTQEGDRMFHNAEVGPVKPDATQSQLSILTASPGENIFHCNKYLRLKVPEVDGLIIPSSEHRMEAICRHASPKTREDVIDILSDQTDNEYRVFQEIGPDDYVKTIAVGIFDCIEKNWSLYTDIPKYNDPILVIPLQLNNNTLCHLKNGNGVVDQ
ncbi:uncharacterized protein LOC107263304 isoform X2 [Cephus cinctus]|uniref:Uncharacterized protein LOC107263304 isoform X2 n=1 Tax=Cephus cinctus TaxID=211228 RepID=A0AAJ7R9J3_CEPCN|nr:uncharacterized protein LOC107263304 isoform X2 [Cephus cinctus]